MNKPTPNASAGKFLSRGEDYIHFVDENGDVKAWIDSSGVCWASDYYDSDKFSLMELKSQVDNMAISGLPPFVDAGTF